MRSGEDVNSVGIDPRDGNNQLISASAVPTSVALNNPATGPDVMGQAGARELRISVAGRSFGCHAAPGAFFMHNTLSCKSLP